MTTLDNVDSCAGESLGCVVVHDSKLKPHSFRSLGDDVVKMLRNRFRSAKHIHHVDIARNRRNGAIHFFTEHFSCIGIVDGHWYYLEPGALCVFRHKMPRLMVFLFDSKHSDSACFRDHTTNPFV